MNIRTKICGMTRLEDVQLAADLGVDAIGLIFYAGSKRCINIPTAQTLIKAVPPFMSTVALFVNAQAEDVKQVLAQVPIDILQFHGDETAQFCRQFDRPYLKALRVQHQHSIDIGLSSHPQARSILLDAAVPQGYGGTGQTFDWRCIPKSLSSPWILSGGLTPANIETAIMQTGARAVDVCSGVEKSAGIKDAHKMRLFMQNIADVSASVL